MSDHGDISQLRQQLERGLLDTFDRVTFWKAWSYCFRDRQGDIATFRSKVLAESYLEAAMLLVPDQWYASSIIQDRWKPQQWFVALRKPGGFCATTKKNGLTLAYLTAALLAADVEAGRVRSDD